MDYKSTENIQEATHWISLHDSTSPISDSITPNKVYKLYKIKDDIDFEEYFILDENKNYSMAYMCYKGLFVKEN